MTLNKEYYTTYIIILAVIGLFTLYRAYKKGFFFQLLDVAASIGIIIYSFQNCSKFADQFPLYKENEAVMKYVNIVLWFVLAYIILRILYYFVEAILKWISKTIFKNRALKLVNRLLGLAVGLVKVFIIYSIVCLMCLLPIVKNGNDFVNSTPLIYIKEILIQNRKVVGIDV